MFKLFDGDDRPVHIGAHITMVLGNIWELKGIRQRPDGVKLVVLYDGFLNADTWGLREYRPEAFGLRVIELIDAEPV